MSWHWEELWYQKRGGLASPLLLFHRGRSTVQKKQMITAYGSGNGGETCR